MAPGSLEAAGREVGADVGREPTTEEDVARLEVVREGRWAANTKKMTRNAIPATPPIMTSGEITVGRCRTSFSRSGGAMSGEGGACSIERCPCFTACTGCGTTIGCGGVGGGGRGRTGSIRASASSAECSRCPSSGAVIALSVSRRACRVSCGTAR